MKSVIIIAIVFVLLIPISSTYGSSNWWSDVKFYDDIFVEEEYEKQTNTEFPDWVENPFMWYEEDKISDYEILNIMKFLIHNEIILIDKLPTPECSGDARCIPGIITKIIDGDNEVCNRIIPAKARIIKLIPITNTSTKIIFFIH